MNKKKANVMKYSILTAIMLALTILGGSIERTPLYSRGIVLGLALDKTEKGISALAQTVVNGNSTSPGAASAYDIVEGEGATLSDALEQIAQKSGLLPSFAHCRLLIVGKEFLETEFDSAAVELFKSSLIQDNTRLVASEGTAKDIIKANVPIISTTSEYISNDMKLNAEDGSACVITLKDYVQRIQKGNGTKLLTVAKKISAIPPSSQSGEEEGTFNFFDLNNVAAFDEDGGLHFYGKEVADARSLIKAKKAQYLSLTQGETSVSAEVLRLVKNTRFLSPREVKTNLTYYVKIKSERGVDGDRAKELLTDKIYRTINEAYTTTLGDNVDIFSLKGSLVKKYGKKSENIDIKDITWKVSVNVITR